MKNNKIEDIIYGNQLAFDILDDTIQKLIDIQVSIFSASKVEEYELCQKLQRDVEDTLEDTANVLCKIFGRDKKEGLYQFLKLTYEEIVESIYDTFDED